MLSIILTILKIIGIILLILLILILTVLIVPIRYQAKCAYKKNEEPLLKAKVHWLLRSVLFQVEWKNKSVVIKFKLFGITIIDSSKPKRQKKKSEDTGSITENRENIYTKTVSKNIKSENTNAKDSDISKTVKNIDTKIEDANIKNEDKKQQRKNIEKEYEITDDEKLLVQKKNQQTIGLEDNSQAKAFMNETEVNEIKANEIKSSETKSNEAEANDVESDNDSKDELSESEKIALHNIEQLSKPDNDNMAEKMEQKEAVLLKAPKPTKLEFNQSDSDSKSKKTDRTKDNSSLEDEAKISQNNSKKQDNITEDEKNKENKIFAKIKAVFTGIKNVLIKIKEIFFNIPLYFEKFCGKIENIASKKDKLIQFLEDKENKKTFALTKRQFFKLMRHILPRKLKGYLHFGFDSSATTGYVTGVLAMFYGSYGKNITIQPDFENKVLECDLYFKGRIRIITTLIIGIRLLLDKNFRKLLKQAKNMR